MYSFSHFVLTLQPINVINMYILLTGLLMLIFSCTTSSENLVEHQDISCLMGISFTEHSYDLCVAQGFKFLSQPIYVGN